MDIQDTFVNHLFKKNYGIFSEAIASLASMIVTALYKDSTGPSSRNTYLWYSFEPLHAFSIRR